MFYYYAIFLKKLQPKMFLFENVKGLLNHDQGKIFKIIIETFEKQGYRTSFKLLNAWDYGVAQKRERLIIIGTRKDLITDHHFVFPTKQKYKPVLRDVLLNVPKSDGAFYPQSKAVLFDLVPAGGYWKDLPPKLAKTYMKSCWNMGGGAEQEF